MEHSINNTKLISVIIPAYNAESYVQQAIESVLAQTYHGFEIIVVDDGSTDDTRLIVQNFGDAVRYIYQANQGLSAARNTGIRNSNAEYIALLDADDMWEPEYLEEIYNQFNRFSQAAAVYCGFKYIDIHGRPVGFPSLKVLPPEQFNKTIICYGNWLSACGVVFRRRFAEEVGLFDESLRSLEDADLWIRLSTLYPFIGLPLALVKYRRHDSNMSNDPDRMVLASYQVLKKAVGPAVGDVLSWPKLKIMAYSQHFRLAAIRYLASGNTQKCVQCLRNLAEISPGSLYNIRVWRGLARAQVPDVYQFDPSFKLNLSRAFDDIGGVLRDLASLAVGPVGLKNSYSKIQGYAFLALADEAGKAREWFRTCRLLWIAVRVYTPLLFVRPFWGTLARGLLRAKRFIA